MKKTSKQKCLEMWEWLAKNPKSKKSDYRDHLYDINLGHEYYYCWACKESAGNCNSCPIDWPGGSCNDDNSPYNIWGLELSPEKAEKAAQAMVNLIKETWEE